jgi:hypothetical protein
MRLNAHCDLRGHSVRGLGCRAIDKEYYIQVIRFLKQNVLLTFPHAKLFAHIFATVSFA